MSDASARVSLRDPTLLLAVVPLALAGGLVGSVPIGVIVRELQSSLDAGALGWCIAITAILTGIALVAAVRARWPIIPALGWCTALGWLNAPLCFLASTSTPIDGPEMLGAMLIGGGLLGAIPAIPLGLVYGAVCAYPVHVVARLVREPSLDARARALRVASLAIAPSATVAAVSAELLPGSVPSSSVLAAVAVVATAAAAISHLRLSFHQRFLERVRAGTEPDFTILPLEPTAEHASLPRATASDRAPLNGTLVRIRPGEQAGAYRTAPTFVPCARIATDRHGA